MANDTDNKEYKGPGKFTSAVGRGYVEYVAGAVVGTTGAVTLTKDGREAVKLYSSALKTLSASPDAVKKFEEAISHANLESSAKGLRNIVIAGGGLALIGAIHGIYRGVKNASAAKEQVAELNAELAQSREALAQQKSFTEKLSAEREQAAKAEPTVQK